MSDDAFPYKATSDTALDRTGKPFPVTQSMVVVSSKPLSGWRVNFKLKGTRHFVGGQTPHQVMSGARKLLEDNGIKYQVRDLWANLNLQWLNRTPEKYQFVFLRDLMQILVPAGTEDAAEEGKAIALVNHSPEEWGAVGWRWLGLYLAKDAYDEGAFRRQLAEVSALLDPNVNPSTGCAECFQEFFSIRRTLGLGELPAREDARKWLWQIHNTVNQRLGKPIITYEEAAIANYWT